MPQVQLIRDQDYSVGHSLIDSEHRKLVLGMKALLAARSAVEAEDAAFRLVTVWRSHCDEEEALMESIGYPEIEKHKDIHREFDGLLHYLLQENLNRIENGSEEVARFIFTWFGDHVRKCDEPLAQHIARAGLAAA